MKPELCAVRGYLRHMPTKKSDPVKDRMTARLWGEFIGDECEAALREALAVDEGSFALHGGLAP